MNIKSTLTTAWQAAKTASVQVYEAGTTLDTLCAEFREVLDLRTVTEQVQHRASEGTPISWYECYQEMLVIPWGRISDRHPTWEGAMSWDLRTTVPMESGNAGINERVVPTFKTPHRPVEWEISSEHRIGVPSAVQGYSLMSAQIPSGPVIAIMANFSFTPKDQQNPIIFPRYTAILKLARDPEDWLNDFAVHVHQNTNTLRDIDEAREDAVQADIQQREGTKDTVRAAALGF